MKKILFLVFVFVCVNVGAQVNSCDVNYDNKVNTADVVAIYTNIIDGTVPEKPEMTSKTFEIDGCLLNLVMVPVDGGTFMMGATGEQMNPGNDETPHLVTLSDYYIEISEMPQVIWEAVMGSNPSEHVGAVYPVDNVSWNDCQTFIKLLNLMLADQLNGMKFRLPTEAEWEFAARGGNKSMHYQYSGGNDIDKVGWYVVNSDHNSHAIMNKKSNELGLYDMSGNVWEWCQDIYDGSYDSKPQVNPTGAASGDFRVRRGGSYDSNNVSAHTARRFINNPTTKYNDFGFRLVLAHPLTTE